MGQYINRHKLSTVELGRMVLPPVLFAVYVNNIIGKLNRSKHGSRIGDMYVGCSVYADDQTLISASLYDLQAIVGI